MILKELQELQRVQDPLTTKCGAGVEVFTGWGIESLSSNIDS